MLSDGGLEGAAEFDEGQWRLALRRTIAASDDARLGFEEGVAIPMAFFAWDGSSGESGKRGAVSTWYFPLFSNLSTARRWAWAKSST